MRELAFDQVLRFRMRRQCLAGEARHRGRDGLLCVLEAIGPVGLNFSPAAYVDGFRRSWWDELVEEERVVKARLIARGGTYIAPGQAWLCFAAYGGPPAAPDDSAVGAVERQLLRLVRARGPVTKEELKRTLNIEGRRVYAGLTRLARRLLLVERHQPGLGRFKSVHLSMWDVPERAWGALPRFRGGRPEALRELARFFLRSYGPASQAEILGWAGMADAGILEAVREMSRTGEVAEVGMGGSGERFFALRDELADVEAAPAFRPFVSILAGGDPVVRACREELRREFGRGSSLRNWHSYVLVDGEFRGAVDQHWRERVCWVNNLVLDEALLGDSSRLCELFERLAAWAEDAGQTGLVIAAINGRRVADVVERSVRPQIEFALEKLVLAGAGIGEPEENRKRESARKSPRNASDGSD